MSKFWVLRVLIPAADFGGIIRKQGGGCDRGLNWSGSLKLQKKIQIQEILCS